jgi:hypothetical protein
MGWPADCIAPAMTARALDLLLFVTDRLRIVALALAVLMAVRALV